MTTNLIVETSAGQLYRVAETGDPDLAHVWNGIAVKRKGNGWVDKANARPELVRKAATRIIAELNI